MEMALLIDALQYSDISPLQLHVPENSTKPICYIIIDLHRLNFQIFLL